jgi:RNA polymerase sigma-70 factor (ECF subfamily)
MVNELDITSLIAASRAGDEEAKARLLSCFRDYLRLLAHLHVRPLLKSKFDESDIVQETCMQAIECFEQFRGENEAQFAGWLRQVLANKGAYMARKFQTEKRDARLEKQLKQHIDQSSIDLGTLAPDKYSSPSHQAMGRERVVVLADAIEQLRGEQKDVLIMRGLQGMTIHDVAGALDRSEASTWKLWARGLQALRKIVKEDP